MNFGVSQKNTNRSLSSVRGTNRSGIGITPKSDHDEDEDDGDDGPTYGPDNREDGSGGGGTNPGGGGGGGGGGGTVPGATPDDIGLDANARQVVATPGGTYSRHQSLVNSSKNTIAVGLVGSRQADLAAFDRYAQSLVNAGKGDTISVVGGSFDSTSREAESRILGIINAPRAGISSLGGSPRGFGFGVFGDAATGLGRLLGLTDAKGKKKGDEDEEEEFGWFQGLLNLADVGSVIPGPHQGAAALLSIIGNVPEAVATVGDVVVATGGTVNNPRAPQNTPPSAGQGGGGNRPRKYVRPPSAPPVTARVSAQGVISRGARPQKFIRAVTRAPRITSRTPFGDRFVSLPSRV